MKFNEEQLETIKEELTFIVEVMKGQDVPPAAKKRLTRIRDVLKIFKAEKCWVLTRINQRGNQVVKNFKSQPFNDNLKEFPKKMVECLLSSGEYKKGKTIYILSKA